ncbi:glucans biosynthesis glucosyltransferase MdoH [Albidovulum sp.]|jgi:membrane glycosyltransferase|uniref:glucans biosynthesis glucosyltransferase MdoH n=1 Tax=Albidovulum sp. TaxID=1872424 RepID=UPI0030445C3C
MDGARTPTLLRTVAVLVPLVAGGGAAALFLQYSSAAGLTAWAWLCAALLTLSTAWLAWGAMLALIGLWPAPRRAASDAPIRGRTCVLMPVCNEDPAPTFARVAAMMEALANAPAEVHFAILSDSSRPEAVAGEAYWFSRLMAETAGAGRLFYRRRERNTGRKAGNIADFFRRSGAAYDYALILDADSLMEPATILEMIRRMEAEPRLGLLQTLPVIVRAGSLFGRVMQFAAAFYSPVFARGLARLQGSAGPFWGHNAIVRSRAWAESCGLPELPGKPPFGGHILSHDIVEAALLARAGWIVRVDPDLGGSYEEGPESLIEYARRDRRWCQGNLQHSKVVSAAGLLGWSRLSMALGIVSYIAPVFWAGFLISAVADRATLPPPDYFPDPHQFFPVFPSDETAKAIGLFIGIIGLLVMPKLLILIEARATGRARSYGSMAGVALSSLLDLLLSSLIAPVMMAFQTRAVVQVLRGADGGWPPNRRGEARLTVTEAFEASHFIVTLGLAGLFAAWHWGAGLLPWLLPVLVPMILAPVLISWTSRPSKASALFATPEERALPPILAAHQQTLDRWNRAGNAPRDAAATQLRTKAHA